MIEYKGRYLVNKNSKRVHDLLNSQKGCRLNMMQQDNAIFYDDLKKALNYPNEITPLAQKCKYCFKKILIME